VLSVNQRTVADNPDNLSTIADNPIIVRVRLQEDAGVISVGNLTTRRMIASLIVLSSVFHVANMDIRRIRTSASFARTRARKLLMPHLVLKLENMNLNLAAASILMFQ
jgi:hypothetical protein